jgi:hypothetical protein
MRFLVGVGLFCAGAGFGSARAQDTNFSTGPQYLMTFGSRIFAQSIATPSLTWDNATPFGTTSSSITESAPEEFYQAVASNLDAQRQTALMSIYYGPPAAASAPPTEGSEEPTTGTATVEVGIASVPDAQTLRRRGYGVTLPEAASLLRTGAARANHVYTNDALERLRPKD